MAGMRCRRRLWSSSCCRPARSGRRRWIAPSPMRAPSPAPAPRTGRAAQPQTQLQLQQQRMATDRRPSAGAWRCRPGRSRRCVRRYRGLLAPNPPRSGPCRNFRRRQLRPSRRWPSPWRWTSPSGWCSSTSRAWRWPTSSARCVSVLNLVDAKPNRSFITHASIYTKPAHRRPAPRDRRPAHPAAAGASISISASAGGGGGGGRAAAAGPTPRQ